jgi:hypothetical protein
MAIEAAMAAWCTIRSASDQAVVHVSRSRQQISDVLHRKIFRIIESAAAVARTPDSISGRVMDAVAEP